MKIDFQFNTEYGSFSDAITLEDNHTFTNEDIEVMKQERLTNWIAIITKPAEQVVETPTEDIVE